MIVDLTPEEASVVRAALELCRDEWVKLATHARTLRAPTARATFLQAANIAERLMPRFEENVL